MREERLPSRESMILARNRCLPFRPGDNISSHQRQKVGRSGIQIHQELVGVEAKIFCRFHHFCLRKHPWHIAILGPPWCQNQNAESLIWWIKIPQTFPFSDELLALAGGKDEVMSQFKERPILFSGPMVRAILDGTKTVTRRLVKPQPDTTEQRLRELGAWVEGMTLGEHVNAAWQAGFVDEPCPYGELGDRLWVAESYFINDYRDGEIPEAERAATQVVYQADPWPCWEGEEGEICWGNSKTMPQWASRIQIEVTDVRIEQLHMISIGQICKEGLARSMYEFRPVTMAFDAFADVWDSIYGVGAWNANPWVWVVEFKRVMP